MIRRTIALAVLTAIIGASAPPVRAAYEAHVLVYADGTDVSSLNPFLATTGNSTPLQELTSAEFVRFDPHGNPIPELITEIPTKANHGISPDGKTITYHLRHDVKWSDGAPFDADDVIYTVAVAKNKQNNLTIADPWDRLVGATAPNKYTVVFRLTEPYATFIEDYFSTQSSSCVLPKHVLGPGTLINQAPYNSLPVGIGPFRFKTYNRGDSVVMEANPYYFRGLPKLHEVIYKIVPDQNTLMTQLATGEIDIWDTVNGPLAARAKTLPGHRWTTRLSAFMAGIFFNTSHPQLKDPIVRRALRLASDRNTVFDKVVLRNGTLTESVIPQISRDYYPVPIAKYDPAASARMLDADGWNLGPDHVRHKGNLTLTLDLAIPSGYQPSETLAAILKQDWSQIGVGVTIRIWPTQQFFAIYANGGAIQTGKFDAALYSQNLGPVFANINGVYDCAGFPPRGQNATRYCDPRVDALNNDYLHSYDLKVQKRAAAQMQQLIDDDAPVVILYERAFLAVYDQRLTGYHPHPFSYWGDPMQLDI